MNLEIFDREYRERLPDSPGVYFFADKEDAVLYIGKATSLRDRVRSYFTQDMLLTRGPKIVRMLELATSIRWRVADSALEALILEANLIRQYRPAYNTDAKDDKSWNFVVITKEKFPRVLLERGKKLETLAGDSETEALLGYRIKKLFGPFPSGGSLKEAIKIVRKIFPFRDTCVPVSELEKLGEPRPCFNAQIGLCPGVCVGAVSAREYGKIVRNIELFFEGRKETLVRKLEREMKSEAKALRFERASEIKKTLFSISHIQDVALLKRESFTGSDSERRFRIEAYDVAHLGGADTVGVMTVVENGAPSYREYRKFILRGEANGNDLSALEELLRRRLRHSEWMLPDIIAVDGSNLQRHVAEAVLRDFSLAIPVVSVLKDDRHRPKDILGPKKERDRFRDAILLANGESHRFAISFHRKRRGKSFLNR